MSANASTAIYAKLKALGIELPPVSTPAAAYVPFVQTGNLIFMSGHIAKKDGKPWVGQLGLNMDTATGQAAGMGRAVDAQGHARHDHGGTGRPSDATAARAHPARDRQYSDPLG